jgi:hypothetical protein
MEVGMLTIVDDDPTNPMRCAHRRHGDPAAPAKGNR